MSLDVLGWIQVNKNHGEPFFYDSISMFEKAFLLAALTRVPDDQDIRATANDFAEAVALSTYNHQDDDYYLSGERAPTSSVINISEYISIINTILYFLIPLSSNSA